MIQVSDALRAALANDPPAVTQKANASSRIEDMLREEQQNKQKLRQIKTKYGVKDTPRKMPTMQWVGDNNG